MTEIINLANTSYTDIWNGDNHEPNLRTLGAIQFVQQNCPAAKRLIFHIDSVFPTYSEFRKGPEFNRNRSFQQKIIILTNFEPLKVPQTGNFISCLGTIHPKDDEERDLMRRFGHVGIFVLKSGFFNENSGFFYKILFNLLRDHLLVKTGGWIICFQLKKFLFTAKISMVLP